MMKWNTTFLPCLWTSLPDSSWYATFFVSADQAFIYIILWLTLNLGLEIHQGFLIIP